MNEGHQSWCEQKVAEKGDNDGNAGDQPKGIKVAQRGLGVGEEPDGQHDGGEQHGTSGGMQGLRNRFVDLAELMVVSAEVVQKMNGIVYRQSEGDAAH